MLFHVNFNLKDAITIFFALILSKECIVVNILIYILFKIFLAV